MTQNGSVLERAGRYLVDAATGIRQAPVEVIATLCIALTFSWAIEFGDEAMRYWLEIAASCVLLIAVAWTGTLLHALGTWTATRRWAFTVGGALVVALHALAVQDFEYQAEGWRTMLLLGAAVLWLIALPAFGRGADDPVSRMRRVDGRIVLRMIGALLYGVALFAGLALALRAVTVLFELREHNEIYGHVWAWIFFVLVPWIVLGGLQDYVRPAQATSQVTTVAQRIALYLVPPLLALYGLILYAYVIRIFITGEIPKNLVSPMVLAAGLLGALSLLLFDPRPGAGPLARWLRLAPALFLPLVPLGAWALLVRIGQYGWTEFRVIRLMVLGALAALAIGATVQLIRRRAFALHAAPAAVALVLLLGAIGPWSALALSRSSQEQRLEAALAQANVPLQDSTYARAVQQDSARAVPAAAYEQIRASAQYLVRHFGPDALPPVVRRLARAEDGRWKDYAAELGLRSDAIIRTGVVGMGGSLPHSVPLSLAGGTAYRIEFSSPERPPPGRREVRPQVLPRDDVYATVRDSTRLALHLGERMLFADVSALVASLQRRSAGRVDQGLLPIDQAVVTVTDTAGVSVGEMVVLQLWAERDSTGLALRRVEGLAVVR